MTQGERIRLIRKELNLTLEKFGEKLGVQRSAVSKIERGERGLTDQMIISICREFNVNEQWLRDGTGNAFVPLTKNQQILSFVNNVASLEDNNFKKRLVKALSEMSDEGWDALEQLIDSINEK